jgi:hypothetical protein
MADKNLDSGRQTDGHFSYVNITFLSILGECLLKISLQYKQKNIYDFSEIDQI